MITRSLEEMKIWLKDQVQQGLGRVPAREFKWAQARLIEPRQVTLALDPEGNKPSQFWLVIDHLGQDYGYRIAYYPNDDMFGLVASLKNGVEWYMGNYGSFEETLMMM